MATIKVPGFDPKATVEIPHDGKTLDFKVLPITIDIEEALEACQKTAFEVQNDERSGPLDLFTAEAEQLDVILEPVARPAGDQATAPPQPSAILIEAYKGKKFTRSQLRGLVGEIIEAARPT